jgi:uncharacterized phage-associated protein
MNQLQGIDVAVFMLNRSITIAQIKNDPRYYMDSEKLNMLLFLGQCYLLTTHGEHLFHENIIARNEGPCVESLVGVVTGHCGFGPITKSVSAKNFKREQSSISEHQAEAIDKMLDRYGPHSTFALVTMVKSLDAYKNAMALDVDRTFEGDPIIPTYMLQVTGIKLFGA